MTLPRDICIHDIPFVGTLGRTELEVAAALLVRACQDANAWAPVTPQQVGAAIKADVARDPKHPLWTNPFLRPDIHQLIEKGFARWTEAPGGPLELLPLAIERIAARYAMGGGT